MLASFARWTSAVTTHKPPGITRLRRQAIGRPPPSFSDLLPWTDYLADEQAFLLEDGASRGALFELTPTATEGRTEEFLLRQADALRSAINGSFPELDDGEWVLQFFAQDDPRIDSVHDDLVAYIRPEVLASAYTQDYLRGMRAHLANVSRVDGLFIDTEVSGIRFRGQRRRIRAAVYRRRGGQALDRDGIGPAEQLKNVCERFEASLRQGGVGARRCTGRDFYEWLLPWFNPRPTFASDSASLLSAAPYPGDDELPFGRDFAEMVLLAKPRSDAENGLWYFDELPHAALTLQQLRNKPAVGHLTAERQFDDGRFYALFDKLPDGAVLSITVTIRPQDKLRAHVDAIERAATGDSPEAELSKENCRIVKRRMAEGDKLLPVNLVLYLRGDDRLDLRRKVNNVNATLLPSGLKFIDQRQDLVALTSYVRGLPMAFDPVFDLRHLKRSRLVFSSDLSRLLPVYGRARGTGRPGMLYFNRAGEPLVFDPLHKQDRKKNAHLVLFGPTGAGKSAACTHKLMLQMAVHRPRLFLLEVGGSFTLLGEHFRRHGLTVNQVTLSAHSDISLPPFADAYKMLDQIRRPELTVHEDDLAQDDGEDEGELDADVKRDLLGEMEIAARVMITGGDERENAKLTRADRYLIRLAIIEAARKARLQGRPQLLTEHVADELHVVAKDTSLPEARRIRAVEMGDGMKLFCDGLAGRFFNRSGTPWPDVDVTIVDLSIFAREGYEDQLTVAFLSFMNHVHALVEARQNEARQTIVTVDEAHIITASPLLSPYLTKISKMWRKLGTWLWLLTQNLGDMPDSARRMLNMVEWWICLSMPPDEVEQVKRFRNLSAETVNLLLSARKEPGKYTEGVVLTDNFEALFRNVPPPLALALAMTEKHEKAQRADIMRQHGCSELEAAYRVAALIEAGRA
jgi:conjugative transfer ATPase